MPLLLFLQTSWFFLSLSLGAFSHAATVAASPLSFTFDFLNSSSYNSQDLWVEGTAKLGIPVDLSCNSMDQTNSKCMGRVSYNHPVPFYNTTTGEVASFATQFTFAIKLSKDKSNGVDRGDGMAFFLSNYPSKLPNDSSGGNLGLHNGEGANVSAGERFVAVEFDTFNNTWDPKGIDHIGIDINTDRASVNTTSLPTLSLNGSMTAFITFNNITRVLEATLNFDEHPSRGPVKVSTQLGDPVTSVLPAEVAVGFSAATGGSTEVHQIMFWSFNSTISPPMNSTTSPPQEPGPTGHGIPVGHGILTTMIIGIAVGSAVLIWLIGACIRYKLQGSASVKAANDLAKRYEYRDLANATHNFSEESRLGEGAFGEVYKGMLRDRGGKQQQVAVKKIKGSSGEDFRAELETISKTSHKNLVSLEGWCSQTRFNLIYFMFLLRQKQNVFLVYELVPNGNLDEHLHKREEVLSWARRYDIVKNIGSALRYLHHECKNPIVHRDIKPSNILLDDQFTAKLADFGLSRIAHHKDETLLTTAREKLASIDPRKKLMAEGDFGANQHAVVLTLANGTVDYMDPNCMKAGIVRFTGISDVYSFGIVLLEIACTGIARTGQLRAAVWDLYKRNPENMAVAADARLKRDFDVAEMQRVVVLGLWCSLQDDTKRPSMKKAMEVLEHEATMPELTSMCAE